LIDYSLKADLNEPITITVTDKSGKTIRTLRNAANKAGVNRAVWDLRYDAPTPAPGSGPGELAGRGGAAGRRGGAAGGGAGAAGGTVAAAPAGGEARAGAPGSGEQAAGEGGGEFGGGRFGFGGGPQVVPGDYTITLKAGGKQLTRTVRVGLDPRVKISDADLAAQLNAALELRSLSSTLNRLVAQIDDLTRQLNSLSENLRQGPALTASPAGDGGENDPNIAARRNGRPAPANSGLPEIKTALDELKQLRASLVREAQFSYRYPPRLREEVNSLMFSISGPIAPPTEPQMLRLREVKEETAKAMADLNTILTTTIRKINEKLSNQPHIVTGATAEPGR